MLDWTAFFTFLLFITAWLQLGKFNNTSSAEFLHKLKNDFFTDKTRLLFLLVDNECLKLIKPIDDGIPYFEINLDKLIDIKLKHNVINKIKKFMIENDVDGTYIIDAYEIDDLLLGHFEDLGILEESKILNINMIYEEFEFYITTCWENNDIKDYIEHQRRQKEGWDIYKKFEYIYYVCKLYGTTKKLRRAKTA